jgi:hypothetical protein
MPLNTGVQWPAETARLLFFAKGVTGWSFHCNDMLDGNSTVLAANLNQNLLALYRSCCQLTFWVVSPVASKDHQEKKYE